MVNYRANKGQGGTCVKDLENIDRNLKCRKEGCGLRKRVGEEEALGPTSGKRLLFQKLSGYRKHGL